MLNNTSETPIDYTDVVSFEMTNTCVVIEKKGDPPTPTVVRKATIADLADWALKKVYDAPQGVGFRGDLPPAQRQEAIARWLKVILDYQLAEAEKQAKTAKPVDSPGGFFPNVPASTGTPQ